MNLSQPFQIINVEVHEDLQNIPYSQGCQVRAAVGAAWISWGFWLLQAVGGGGCSGFGTLLWLSKCLCWLCWMIRENWSSLLCSGITLHRCAAWFVLSLRVSFGHSANANKIWSFNWLIITVKQYLPLWAWPGWQLQLQFWIDNWKYWSFVGKEMREVIIWM